MAPSLVHDQNPKHQFTDGNTDTCKKTAAAAASGGALDSPAASLSNGAPQQPLLFPSLNRSTSTGGAGSATSMLLTMFPPLQMLRPTCQLSVASLPAKPGSPTRKRVLGTLYGHRKGRAIFAVQDDPSSEEPLLQLELTVATGLLVKEMASATVRILLECERTSLDAKKANKKKKDQNHHQPNPSSPPSLTSSAALWEVPVWTMFYNGRRGGCATPHPCGEHDRRVLHALRTVSAGAGVLPPPPSAKDSSALSSEEKGKKPVGGCCHGGRGDRCCGGESLGGNQEVMYIRSKFERVVASKDSEAFYMMSPGGGKAGNPELSIFLLRS